jgi:hypothetical protein
LLEKNYKSPVAKGKRRKMNYCLWIVAWFTFAASVIYWDIQRWEDEAPVSECHNAEIKIYHDRPMCMECKLYCEVKKD